MAHLENRETAINIQGPFALGAESLLHSSNVLAWGLGSQACPQGAHSLGRGVGVFWTALKLGLY